MGKIINTEEDSKHTIKKFSFNRLDVGDNDIIFENSNPFDDSTIDDKTVHKEPSSQKELTPDEKKEFLEKIEQLTSDVIRVQMELEKKEQEFKQELARAKEESYEKGKNDAIQALSNEMEGEIEQLKTQLIKSIELIDEQKMKFEHSLENLENELLETTFILAKKVIAKEVEKDSAKIATQIAKELIKIVKESSNITLKVNPYDKEFISSQIKASMIKIEADEAIQKGGVVILSENGNISGDISTRFKQALQLLQKES